MISLIMYGQFPCMQNLMFFRHFHAYVCTKFQLPLIALQTDNGKEFDNLALRRHLASSGIALRLSCPYTSPQNGKAERILRTLNDCVRCLLLHAGIPESFWVKALATATHLLNRRPCQASGTATPFERLLRSPPSYDHLSVRVFVLPQSGSHDASQAQCSLHAMRPAWLPSGSLRAGVSTSNLAG